MVGEASGGATSATGSAGPVTIFDVVTWSLVGPLCLVSLVAVPILWRIDSFAQMFSELGVVDLPASTRLVFAAGGTPISIIYVVVLLLVVRGVWRARGQVGALCWGIGGVVVLTWFLGFVFQAVFDPLLELQQQLTADKN